MVTLKLVPTLSDPCRPGEAETDPFEQAVWAGAGRSAKLTDVERAVAAARAAHPAGKARGRTGRRLAVVAADESRLPRQRSTDPRSAEATKAQPGATQRGAARQAGVRPDAAPGAAVRTRRARSAVERPVASAAARTAGPDEKQTVRARDGQSGATAARGGCRPVGRPGDGRSGRRIPRRGPARTSAAGAATTPLRLTKRGRALIRSVVLLGVALVVAALTVTSRADGDVRPVASRSIVVAEHDTLWTIAEEVAPDRPRSQTMNEIRELNDMSDAELYTGQRLLIPASR